MPDIHLTCCECSNPFYWKESDQKYYATKDFKQPRRCYACRMKRKQNNSPQQTNEVSHNKKSNSSNTDND